MSGVLHVPPKHPLNQLGHELQARFIQAQKNLVEAEFCDSGEFLRRVFDDLKLKLKVPAAKSDQPVGTIADLDYKSLVVLKHPEKRCGKRPPPGVSVQHAVASDKGLSTLGRRSTSQGRAAFEMTAGRRAALAVLLSTIT
jgi:hypothetical protein